MTEAEWLNFRQADAERLLARLAEAERLLRTCLDQVSWWDEMNWLSGDIDKFLRATDSAEPRESAVMKYEDPLYRWETADGALWIRAETYDALDTRRKDEKIRLMAEVAILRARLAEAERLLRERLEHGSECYECVVASQKFLSTADSAEPRESAV